jgi:hypothetical protein
VNHLTVRSCLIDGEVVACDGDGLAVFERLRAGGFPQLKAPVLGSNRRDPDTQVAGEGKFSWNPGLQSAFVNAHGNTSGGGLTPLRITQGRLLMRAVLAGAALAVLAVTPTLADYYIVQEPSTKRCRIVEERPAPGVGVIIGGVGFGVRTEAESRMRTECRESGTTGETIIEERERRPAR